MYQKACCHSKYTLVELAIDLADIGVRTEVKGVEKEEVLFDSDCGHLTSWTTFETKVCRTTELA